MNKWIDVKVKMPEFDYVVVLVAVCPVINGNETHMGFIDGNEWVVVSAKGNHTDFITHWMPLPEPPKDK